VLLFGDKRISTRILRTASFAVRLYAWRSQLFTAACNACAFASLRCAFRCGRTAHAARRLLRATDEGRGLAGERHLPVPAFHANRTGQRQVRAREHARSWLPPPTYDHITARTAGGRSRGRSLSLLDDIFSRGRPFLSPNLRRVPFQFLLRAVGGRERTSLQHIPHAWDMVKQASGGSYH